MKMGVMTEEIELPLEGLLKEYRDVFAFDVEEMPGIYPSVAVHKLNVNPDA